MKQGAGRLGQCPDGVRSDWRVAGFSPLLAQGLLFMTDEAACAAEPLDAERRDGPRHVRCGSLGAERPAQYAGWQLEASPPVCGQRRLASGDGYWLGKPDGRCCRKWSRASVVQRRSVERLFGSATDTARASRAACSWPRPGTPSGGRPGRRAQAAAPDGRMANAPSVSRTGLARARHEPEPGSRTEPLPAQRGLDSFRGEIRAGEPAVLRETLNVRKESEFRTKEVYK